MKQCKNLKKIQKVYHYNVYELHLSNGKILEPTANHPFFNVKENYEIIFFVKIY